MTHWDRAPDEPRTLLDVFRERAERDGGRIALEDLAAGGAREPRALTWRQWHDASREAAAALVAAGVAPGDAVAILAGNRSLWPVADLGALMAGAVSVGLYPTSAPAQVEQILADCGAVAVIVDTPEQLAKVSAARPRLPRLRAVVCEEAPADAAACGVVSWREWMARGAAALGDPAIAREVAARTEAASPETIALLIYTSGSTGEPKGARIPHRYLGASAESVRQTLGLGPDDTTLSFLPYCHAAERVFGLYTRILCGMRTGHVEEQARLWDAARAFQPTLFGALPRWYEKLHEALLLHERTLPEPARARWEEAIRLGRERTALRRAGQVVPDALEGAWRAASTPCRERLAAMVGARVRVATSGGAALPAEVADYLDAAGLTVLGAYGQTEHLCVAFHRADAYDTSSAGAPMPGTEVRIAPGGELLVRRGALTFDGYHGRPDETRDAFTPDGAWLRTGDLAELTPEGRLRITGRTKELIALAGGKKVAPLPIEAALAQDPWIAQAMLYGEGERFITALLVPSRAMVAGWLRERATDMPYEEALRHPELLARLQQAVDRVNERLSRPEQVRRWAVLAHELTVERGELTPTQKIRRSTVAERYRAHLDPLYR
ncbi:MAG TPA: AMP-dependent synthetase/ligase [Gemmatimonadaceae bacterium]|nr:AMP-dependent synthetase/ligase [Gemmatimonadaceae bacterium]